MLGLCFVPDCLLSDQLSSQTLCHAFLPVPSLPAKFTTCSSTCPLFLACHLQPLLPNVLPFLLQINLWWSVVSSIYFLPVDLPAVRAPWSKDCLTVSLCSAHHSNVPKQSEPSWCCLTSPFPCTRMAMPSLPHGCNKVISTFAADTVSEGQAEITAHTGAAWWWWASF